MHTLAKLSPQAQSSRIPGLQTTTQPMGTNSQSSRCLRAMTAQPGSRSTRSTSAIRPQTRGGERVPQGASVSPPRPATSGSCQMRLSSSPKFGVWGFGPGRAGSTRWHRDRRLEKRSDIFECSLTPGTQFKKIYERGDLPITIRHGTKNYLEWRIPVEKLDYAYFLPIFVDGIREKSEPFRFVATEGTIHLIKHGQGKLLPIVPLLIRPLKAALSTRDPQTVVQTMHVLQALAQSGGLVGEALVPYYRQLLPMLSIFKAKKRNLGDEMDYAQRKKDWRNLGELIEDTLNVLELTGGEDAFVNIKYMIPTYESCVYN